MAGVLGGVTMPGVLLGQDAVPALLDVIRAPDTSKEVRIEAALSAVWLGDSGLAADALIELVETDPAQALAAAHHLARGRIERAAPAIARALARSDMTDTNSVAGLSDALREVGGRPLPGTLDRIEREAPDWLAQNLVEDWRSATDVSVPAGETVTLWRPCNDEELALVSASAWRAWPPRLDWQPIFYPVLNEAYATEIARGFQIPASGRSHVTRFNVEADYLARYPVQCVGDRTSLEYWIPAEDLHEFNEHIVGLIEVVATYEQDQY